MNKNIEYTRFSLDADKNLVNALIVCYRDVFAEEPWDEWKKCSVCDKKWGKGSSLHLKELQFSHYDKKVVDFWPKEVVQNDLRSEIKNNTSYWIALDYKKVVGFCWGYPISIESLEQKLELPYVSERILSFCFGKNDLIAYQDEIGVLKEYRGHKIANEMFNRRLADFKSLGLSLGVGRTIEDPPSVTYHWFKKLGYRIIDRYSRFDIEDKRVIVARSLVDFLP